MLKVESIGLGSLRERLAEPMLYLLPALQSAERQPLYGLCLIGERSERNL